MTEKSKVPTPKGHYSPAVVHDGIVYVSGQLPIDYVNGATVPIGGILEQTRQALVNLVNVLEEYGSGKNQVLRTTIYITDMQHWAEVNKAYADYFGAHRPARTIIPVGPLHYGSLLEIDAVAYVKE